MATHEKIAAQKPIAKGPSFSMNDALSFGWQTVKGNLCYFTILLILIILIETVITTAAQYSIGLVLGGSLILAGLINWIISTAVGAMMQLGLIDFSLRFYHDDRPRYIEFFNKFNVLIKVLTASFIAQMITLAAPALILTIIFGPELLSGGLNIKGHEMELFQKGIIAIIVSIPFLIYFGVVLIFNTYLVVDKDMGPLDAVQESIRITKGAFRNLVTFSVTLFFINVLGVLALVVGLFVSIPVSMLAFAHVYRQLADRADEIKMPHAWGGQQKGRLIIIILLAVSVIICCAAVGIFAYKGAPVYKALLEKQAAKSAPAKPGAPALAPVKPVKIPSVPGMPVPSAVPASPAAGTPAVQQDLQSKSNGEGVYEYNAKGRRDPFLPLIVKPELEKKKGGYTPMESYEISEFKLIAVLWNKTGYYAVITLPDGKSYTVREGIKIGLHGGKVHKINRDSVIIREPIKGQKGPMSSKDTILKLRREE